MMDANASERALTRIARMEQDAEELTKALGLPPDAIYTVMAAMYKVKTSSAIQEAQLKIDDARLKELVYQLSNGFINERMKESALSFHSLWSQIKTFSLESLEQLSNLSTAPQGIGFTSASKLLPVVSTISWAVLNYSAVSKTDPEQIRAILAKEAEDRGCSRASSNALARYIQNNPPYKIS